MRITDKMFHIGFARNLANFSESRTNQGIFYKHFLRDSREGVKIENLHTAYCKLCVYSTLEKLPTIPTTHFRSHILQTSGRQYHYPCRDILSLRGSKRLIFHFVLSSGLGATQPARRVHRQFLACVCGPALRAREAGAMSSFLEKLSPLLTFD